LPACWSQQLAGALTNSQHVYEVRPRKDKRGVDLISDALPFGRLWYGEPNAASNAIGYAGQYSRSHGAVIRVYDDAGNVIEAHEHAGQFKESVTRFVSHPCDHSNAINRITNGNGRLTLLNTDQVPKQE
jgi:hypothetical protein